MFTADCHQSDTFAKIGDSIHLTFERYRSMTFATIFTFYAYRTSQSLSLIICSFETRRRHFLLTSEPLEHTKPLFHATAVCQRIHSAAVLLTSSFIFDRFVPSAQSNISRRTTLIAFVRTNSGHQRVFNYLHQLICPVTSSERRTQVFN